MSQFTLLISKPNQDVFNTPLKDLAFVGGYDTLKIHRTGILQVEIPPMPGAFMIAEMYTDTYIHNLGYIPYIEPTSIKFFNTWNLAEDSEIDVNDFIQIDTLTIPTVEPSTAESVEVYATVNGLTLRVFRATELIEQDFGSRKLTLHYTIYYNDMNTNFTIE